MTTALDAIASQEVFDHVLLCSTPASWHHALLSTPQVKDFQESLRCNAVSETQIRNLVYQFTESFQRGRRSEFDLNIAAIAVALEDDASEFADEFIDELASLKIHELPVATHVARECQKARTMRFAQTTSRELRIRWVDEKALGSNSTSSHGGSTWISEPESSAVGRSSSDHSASLFVRL